MGKYLKSACFYTIRKCRVRKPDKYGGEFYRKKKYCLSALSDRSAGFLVNSKPRRANVQQIKILPKEMNKHIPEKYLLKGYKLTQTSYVNLSELKGFDDEEIASAIELCPIPCSVAEKIVENLEKNPFPSFAKKVIHELKTLILRSR